MTGRLIELQEQPAAAFPLLGFLNGLCEDLIKEINVFTIFLSEKIKIFTPSLAESLFKLWRAHFRFWRERERERTLIWTYLLRFPAQKANLKNRFAPVWFSSMAQIVWTLHMSVTYSHAVFTRDSLLLSSIAYEKCAPKYSKRATWNAVTDCISCIPRCIVRVS